MVDPLELNVCSFWQTHWHACRVGLFNILLNLLTKQHNFYSSTTGVLAVLPVHIAVGHQTLWLPHVTLNRQFTA